MNKILFRTLMIAFAVIFVVSAFFIIKHYAEESRNENDFNELINLKEEILLKAAAELNGAGDENTPAEDPRLIAYRELYSRNNDFAGWIKIEGTRIDFPVMQTVDDPEYYLKRNFEKQYSVYGTPFIDAGCNLEDYDNLTIYGHNMKSGAMFAGLLDYVSEDFYQQHTIIQFDTLDEIGEYEIVAVFKSQVYTTDPGVFQYYLFTKADNKETYDEFVSKIKELSLYDTGVSAGYGDKLITLSTCEYSKQNGRMVIVAKKIVKTS